MTNLQNSCTVDKAKEGYIRHKIQCQISPTDQKEKDKEHPTISKDSQDALTVIVSIIDLMPYLDILKEHVLFMPSYHVSIKGDFTLKSPLKLSGHQQQELTKKDELLWECEKMLPTYYLMCLDARIQ